MRSQVVRKGQQKGCRKRLMLVFMYATYATRRMLKEAQSRSSRILKDFDIRVRTNEPDLDCKERCACRRIAKEEFLQSGREKRGLQAATDHPPCDAYLPSTFRHYLLAGTLHLD